MAVVVLVVPLLMVVVALVAPLPMAVVVLGNFLKRRDP
jgi:hypothetical protein